MTTPSGTQNFKPDDSRVPTVAKVADEDVLEEQRLEEEEAEAQRQAEVDELNEPRARHREIKFRVMSERNPG
jgi:hypothetical protein